jgi:autotransporter-associated beta strand protein
MKPILLFAFSAVIGLSIAHGDMTLFNQTDTLDYSDATPGPMNIGNLFMSGTSVLDVDSTASTSITDGPSQLQLSNSNGGDETIDVANSGSGNLNFQIGTFGRHQGTTINFEESNTGGGTNEITSPYNLNGGDGNDLTFWAFYGGNDFAASNGSGQIVAGTAYYNDGGADTGATNLATWASASGNNQDYTSDSAATTYTGVLTGDATKHGLRVSNAAGASLDLGGHTLTEAGLIDAQGAGAVTISDGTLTAQNLTNELIVNQNNTANAMTITANITGSNSSFVKSGLGTLYLVDYANYGGTTWVNSGTLVENAVSFTNNVVVQKGATLAGDALLVLSDGATVYGSLAPGSLPPGTPGSFGGMVLEFNSRSNSNNKLSFLPGSTLDFNINGADFPGVAFTEVGDWLSGSGNADLALNVSDVQSNTPYVVFENVTTTGFDFSDITGTPTGYTPTLTFTGADGGAFGATYADDYVLTFAETPEPSTWAMMGLGAAVLLWRVRRPGTSV